MFGRGNALTTVDANFKDHLQTVKQIFRSSHAQRMALNQIIVDAIWSCAKIDEEKSVFEVTSFLTLLLEHLMVTGYALFRLRHGLPEIADSALYYIETNGNQWRPRLYANETSVLKGSKWHLVVLDPPAAEMRPVSLFGSKNKVAWVTMRPSSAATRAMLHSLSLDELILHRRQRNMFNSQPTMFMSEPIAAKNSKELATVGWQTQYVATSATDAAAPVNMHSYQQKLQQRLMRTHMLRENDLALLTDQIRSGNAVGSVPTIPGGLKPTREPGKQAHAELLLSSGLEHTVSRHLEGDSHEATISRDLTYAIYDSYRVPPGKFGLNRNTERMAGERAFIFINPYKQNVYFD